jgi:hypothetical protein
MMWLPPSRSACMPGKELWAGPHRAQGCRLGLARPAPER